MNRLEIKALQLTAVIATAALVASCDNMVSRSGWGEMTVDLPCNTKYMHASWKDQTNELWYATRPFGPGDQPETITYHSKSPLGLMEGTVRFVEKVCT